jgi:hypothetical protein
MPCLTGQRYVDAGGIFCWLMTLLNVFQFFIRFGPCAVRFYFPCLFWDCKGENLFLLVQDFFEVFLKLLFASPSPTLFFSFGLALRFPSFYPLPFRLGLQR